MSDNAMKDSVKIPMIRVRDNQTGEVRVIGNDGTDRLYIDLKGRLQYLNTVRFGGTANGRYSFTNDSEGYNPLTLPIDDGDFEKDDDYAYLAYGIYFMEAFDYATREYLKDDVKITKYTFNRITAVYDEIKKKYEKGAAT